jgi:hypothetical protein
MSTLVQPEWSKTFEEVMVPYCSTRTERCNSRARYRSPDGSCFTFLHGIGRYEIIPDTTPYRMLYDASFSPTNAIQQNNI